MAKNPAAAGKSNLRYEPVADWGVLADNISFCGDATAVAVDSRDDVYVFNRGTHPMVILDKNGNLLGSWAKDGDFVRPHGLTIDHEDFLYLVDTGGHFVDKRTRDGELVFRLGREGKPAAWQGGEYFNGPTGVIVHPSGDIFVADGYGNSRVHRFNSHGKHLLSWGSPGSGPGAFSLPHDLCLLGSDHVVVCDRENFRLQLFSLEGTLIDQWHAHHPSTIVALERDEELLFVGELGPVPTQVGVTDLGHSVAILDHHGHRLARFGNELPGSAPGQFIAPHGIAVDSNKDVYVAEVAASWSSSFWGGEKDPSASAHLPSLRKWRRCVDTGLPKLACDEL